MSQKSIGAQTQSRLMFFGFSKTLWKLSLKVDVVSKKKKEEKKPSGGKVKLSDEDVSFIRNSNLKPQDLAQMFSVTEAYVKKIRSGEVRPLFSRGSFGHAG